jgi:hypothetical protein
MDSARLSHGPILALLALWANLWSAGCAGAGGAPVAGTGGESDSPSDPLPPRISEALDCGTLASAGGLGGAGSDREDPLVAHFFDPAVFPDALCNDGTPGTVYFRPAQDPVMRDRWVIELMGGGGCRTADACADRWCAYETNFGMTQMTSSVAPRATEGKGILQEDEPGHPWAGYNHVLVRYCSSDNWSGTVRDVVLDGHHPVTGAEVRYRVDFLGARILDATLDTLRQDGVPALRWEYGGGIDMPDLDDAAEVVFAGASAGGGGVVRSIDRLAATLATEHCPTCPPLVVRGLIDSSYGPAVSELDFSTSTLCTGAGVCSYEQLMREETTTGGHALWGARMDESCVAWHRMNEPGTEWECADNGHVLSNHLTTPFFVRQGLSDSLISSNLVETMFTVPGGGLITPMLFAMLTRTQLLALADVRTLAEEGAAVPVPGVFGPLCSKHETLRCDDTTFRTTVRSGGEALGVLDVWRNWTSGSGPTVAVSSVMGDTVCSMTCSDGL